jgi:hypothetical protein
MKTPYPITDHVARVLARMKQRKAEDRREARVLRDPRIRTTYQRS